MKTVALIEGFSGGPLHTRDFRRALAAADFLLEKNPRVADIIIAHSAGIYAVPADSRAKLLVLIGPTYWPGRPLLKRFMTHYKAGRRYLKNFGWKYFWWTRANQLMYTFLRNRYLWLGILHNNDKNFLEKLVKPKRTILLVRNSDDAFCSPGLKSLANNKNILFVELPGIHDDFVKNHAPYIKLLKSYAKQLA